MFLAIWNCCRSLRLGGVPVCSGDRLFDTAVQAGQIKNTVSSLLIFRGQGNAHPLQLCPQNS